MSIRFRVESVTLTVTDETITMVIVPTNEEGGISQTLDNLGRFTFMLPHSAAASVEGGGFSPGAEYELRLVDETPAEEPMASPPLASAVVRADASGRAS